MFEPIVIHHTLAGPVAEAAKSLNVTTSELAEMCIEIVLGQPTVMAALRKRTGGPAKPKLTVLVGGVP